MIKNFLDDIYILKNMSSKEFEEINDDFKLLTPEDLCDINLIKLIKKNNIRYLLSSIGIINVNQITEKNYNSILGIHNKKTKTNILFKKEKKHQKKYNDISSLSLNQNINLFVNQNDNYVEIICYQNKPLEILFYGKICKLDEEDDYFNPFDSGTVESIASIRDINARLIVYPILAYFVDSNIIMSDRNIVSHKAKSVWYQYFNKNGILDKYAPLCDSNLFYDQNYHNTNFYKINKKKINKKFNKKNDSYKRRLIISLKKEHYLDWVFKLNGNFKKNIEKHIKILSSRHKKRKTFEEKISKLSDHFFHNLIS